MWTSHLQTLIYWYVIYWGMIWYGIIQNAQHWGANNTTSLIAIFVLTSSNTTHSEHIKYIDEITVPYQPWYQEIWLRTAICIFTTYQKVNEMFVCCNNISKGQMIALCFPQFHSTLYIPPISSFLLSSHLFLTTHKVNETKLSFTRVAQWRNVSVSEVSAWFCPNLHSN